jgi:hypothetical protein
MRRRRRIGIRDRHEPGSRGLPGDDRRVHPADAAHAGHADAHGSRHDGDPANAGTTRSRRYAMLVRTSSIGPWPGSGSSPMIAVSCSRT